MNWWKQARIGWGHLLALALAVASCAGTAFAADGAPSYVPADHLVAPDGMEVTVWATSPMLHNPTNMERPARETVSQCLVWPVLRDKQLFILNIIKKGEGRAAGPAGPAALPSVSLRFLL
jgi:hypothetical protein